MLEIADEDAKTVIIKTVFHMFISLRRQTWKIKKNPNQYIQQKTTVSEMKNTLNGRTVLEFKRVVNLKAQQQVMQNETEFFLKRKKKRASVSWITSSSEQMRKLKSLKETKRGRKKKLLEEIMTEMFQI